MKIQTKDFYHGAALTQIVEHPSFTALNKAGDKYGHYIVNYDIRLIVKYSSPGNGPWQFTFNSDDLEIIQNDIDGDASFYACLICGEETICLLGEEDLQKLIDTDTNDIQWVRVDSPPRRSMRVTGSQGKLGHTVAHNVFPNRLFE
jgi:hypothetical protein